MKYPYSTDEAWRVIRALRHKPPGNANDGDAKLLFTSATKQSEQLFRLSDQAGYETKPILLYYGLNQASRAVRAVAELPGGDRAWEPRGHGITCPDVDTPTKLGDLVVKDSRPDKRVRETRGYFQKFAQLLGSPTLSEPVQLRDVWACTPEGVKVLLEGSDGTWCCTSVSANYREGTWPPPADDRPDLSARLNTVSISDVPQAATRDNSPSDLEHLIHQRYPELAGYGLRLRADGKPAVLTTAWSFRGYVSLEQTYRPLQLDGMGLVVGLGNAYYRDFSREMWLIPTVGSQAEPLHPLINWWAILFALSMLARYQPSGWTRMLDVDSSPDATAIEYVLSEAHRVCVNLLAHLLEELALVDRHGML